MHFLAMPLLGGVLLASVPIIIHLLNRRRYKLVEWAPMKYLKLTLQTNRRRMRIEQLLLLAVRILVVTMLFLALARPALSSSGLGNWLASRARTSRVLVIDDSMSMGYQSSGKSAFDSAKEAATEIIKGIGKQDSVTVVTTSHLATPLLHAANLQDSGKLLSQISLLSPTDAPADWATILKRVDELLEASAHPQREIILITDLRRSGWGAEVKKTTEKWAGESTDLKIIDVGDDQTVNTTLTRFEQEDTLALPGTPVKLRAAIRNDTAAPIRGGQATLEIDGQPRPMVLPELPPRQTTEVPLTVNFPRPGQHLLKLNIPGDSLAGDNVRFLAVSSRSEVNVAMVDGRIDSRPFESSTDYVQVALTAGTDPWNVTRRADTEWRGRLADPQLRGADVIVLSNVSSLSNQQVSELEKLVNEGTGLMIFCGELVDVALYNQQLYRDGAGLLPAKLERATDEAPTGLLIEGLDDSPLFPLTSIVPDALARVRPKRFITSTISQRPDQIVRVLARWNNAQTHPAVVEKRFGRGRVVLFTTSADRQWGDWPIDPTYVLSVRSVAATIARPEPAATNFSAGQEIAWPLLPEQVVRNPFIAPPDESAPQAMLADEHRLRFVDTSRAGKYAMTWKDARDIEQSRFLSASFDAAESNLAPIPDEEVIRILSPMNPTIVHWLAGAQSPTEGGTEIWRTLMVIVLALLGMETILATWVGREK